MMALADRRGYQTGFLYAFDPWMYRWVTQTRRLMRAYRVRP